MDNGANNLPSSILGDGRKFVSLLKNYLKGLQDDINEKLGEVTKIYNSVADTPDTIDEQVHSITVEEKAVNGNISLLVKWNSDNIKKYAGAVIDIKIGDFHTTLAGFTTQQWVKHYETTKTNQYLIDNIEPGQNYLIRVRGKNVYNAKSIEAKAPMIAHYVEPNKHVPRPPYEGTVVFDKRGAYWSWKQYDQNQYMWTELRLDEHPGNLFNRLEVTTDLHSEVKPFGRTGTGYLYNRGVGNSYSAPFKIPYAKAVPGAPGNLTIKHVADGLYIKFDKIPEDCFGANLYINNEKIELKENEYTYICSTGTYVIKVAYVDIFGEGTMSSPKTVTVQEVIDPEVYKNESLSYKRIADAQKKIQEVRSAIDSVDSGVTSKITQLSNAIDAKVADSNKQNESRITATANSINSTVRELQGKVGTITSSTIPSLQSNITQLSNSIDLRVSNANKALTGQEIVSRINLSPNGVSILGKYVHITGDTVIDGNVITAKHIGDKAIVGTKIAEGAITTDKISANAITSAKIASNAITSDKILAKAITSDHMEVDSIEGNRIKSSSIDADKLKANSITGDKLVADSITGDKIKAGSVTVDKLGAGVIDLNEIGASIQGGYVRIDGKGMSVGQRNGSYTTFSDSGLIWYDSKGVPYGSVRRMIKGEARHGDRININWDTTPFVMVTPDIIPIYGATSTGRLGQEIHCRAINVSGNGFEIEAFTQLEKPDGLVWAKPWNYVEWERTSDIIVWAPYEVPVIFSKRYGISVVVNGEIIKSGKLEAIRQEETTPEGKMVKAVGFDTIETTYSTGSSHTGHSTHYVYHPLSAGKQVHRLSSQPFESVNITLKKGLNFITGFLGNNVGFDLPLNESLGWITDPPDFLKFYKPFDAPVKFVAIDFPIENYYSIQKTGFVVTNFSGRGIQKFKPKNRRFKVVLIGASSAIEKARPATSETKISWGDKTYSTSKTEILVGGFSNNQEKQYPISDYHPSWKHDEQPEETFFASDFGLGYPHGWELHSTPFKIPGYLTNTSLAFFLEVNTTDKASLEKNGMSPSFKMSWDYGTRMSKWGDGYFGPSLNIIGAPVPSKIQSDSHHGARGGYHREMHGYFAYQMGMSQPVVQEISIPENEPIPEFTITIGACPDAWIGKKIPLTGTLGGRSSIEIVDTKIFDGGVIIIEEEASKQVS